MCVMHLKVFGVDAGLTYAEDRGRQITFNSQRTLTMLFGVVTLCYQC